MRTRLILLCSLLVASLFFYFSLQNNYISLTLAEEHSFSNQYNIQGVSGRLLVSPYGVQDELIDIISQTQHTLWMWQYDITATNIIALIQNLAMLGVDIKIILENDMYQGGSKSRDKLTKSLAGTPVEIKSDEHLGIVYNHTKTILTDNHVIISTANLGYQGFWNNREYWFVVDDLQVVEAMKELFLLDWEGKSIDTKTLPEEVVFCPINCRSMIDALLGSARYSIHLHGQYLQDPEMIDQLLRLQDDGINIKLLLGKYQNVDLLKSFHDARIQYSPYLHVKALLIDNNILLITSMNFSTNAIENNREIGMLIEDKTAIETFIGQFYQDWKKATILSSSGGDTLE